MDFSTSTFNNAVKKTRDRDSPLPGIVPVGLEVDLGRDITPNLEPVGSSGWYWSGYDAVDPRDCEKWPNSPYCSGAPLPVDPFDITDVSLELTLSANACETCYRVDPKILGISGPSSIVCYRREECRVPEPEEPEDRPWVRDGIEESKLFPQAPANIMRVVFSVAVLFNLQYADQVKGSVPLEVYEDSASGSISYSPGVAFLGGNTDLFSLDGNNRFRNTTVRRWESPGRVFSPFIHYSRDSFRISSGSIQSGVDDEGREYEYRLIKALNTRTFYVVYDAICNGQSIYRIQLEAQDFWNGFIANNIEYFQNTLLFFSIPSPSSVALPIFRANPNQLILAANSIKYNCESLLPPSNQPIPTKEPMGCCDETLELLEAIYKRIGVNEFPVKTPALLVQDQDSQISLENHAQLWEWTARNMDALIGQFPLKIKIEDTDPTKSGNQELEVSLPNVSEALAEVFGLTYEAEMKIDLLVDVLLRLVPEVLATKNAALVGQSFAKANASYLGYEGNMKETSIDYNFDLENPENIPRFLTETKRKILTYRDESKGTLKDSLSKLEFAAGIIKAVHYVQPSRSSALLDAIQEMVSDEALSIPNKEKWRDWLQRMNADQSKFNKDQTMQPSIVEDVHEGLSKLDTQPDAD